MRAATGWGFLLAVGVAVLAVAGCRRDPDTGTPGPILGAPVAVDDQEGAYEGVLRYLPEAISADLPGVAPVLCLDRGIRVQPTGAYVAEHRRRWLERLARDDAIAGTSNRSPARCSARTFWVTVSAARRQRGDTLAVPVSYEYVLRAGAARIDRVTTTLRVARKGRRWVVVGADPGGGK